MKKLLLFAIVILGFSAVSFGQVGVGATANATSSATIITPISITKTIDMNFGNVAVTSTGGTVILAPTAAADRTTTGGVTLPVVKGTVTAATFTVAGEGTSTYSITLPTTNHTITSGASNSMIVNAFTSTPTGNGTLTGGTQTIYVGATLTVTAAQPAGLYTNATGFPVTVNYN